tara:strand:- start:433 stop:720 length:288 start_codon:yes stop_codon:yes gene_type:complete
MKKLTTKKVKQYIAWRSNQELRHCPDCIAAACNDMAIKFSNEFTTPKITGLDFMKLLFFNDPIEELHTHSYGFNTATGRAIIESLKIKYYEYESE